MNNYKDTIMLSGFAPKGFRTKLCKLFDINSRQKGLWVNIYGVKHKETGQISSFGSTIAVKQDVDQPSQILRKIKYSQAKDIYTIQQNTDEPVVTNDIKQRNKLKALIAEILSYMETKSSESEGESK